MPKLIGRSYWVLGMERWGELAQGIPSLAPGTPLSLLMGWNNDGLGTVQGRVNLNISRPDGSQVALAAVANQDKAASPSNGWMVQFAPVVLDQIGDYRADAILEVQGQASLPQLWDGIVWLVNSSDMVSDWSFHFDFFAASQLVGSMDKTWQMGPNSSFAPYTWQVLGAFASPAGVDRIDITAKDNGRTLPTYDEYGQVDGSYWYRSSSTYLIFHKPPGRDPLQEDLNATGQAYFNESGKYTVVLASTL